MQNCNPCRTPIDTESKLVSDGDPVSDPTLYRSLAGALRYLTFTRLDLSYAFQQVCLYMHDPRDPHFTALKRILRYVRGTLDYGLQLHVTSTTQHNCVYLCLVLVLKDEYRVYCDNVSAVYMSANLVQHQRTKHIEIDIHFVRDFVASGQVRVLHVPSRFQYADIFTKGLPTALFIEFRSSLNVRRSPAHTEGGGRSTREDGRRDLLDFGHCCSGNDCMASDIDEAYIVIYVLWAVEVVFSPVPYGLYKQSRGVKGDIGLSVAKRRTRVHTPSYQNPPLSSNPTAPPYKNGISALPSARKGCYVHLKSKRKKKEKKMEERNEDDASVAALFSEGEHKVTLLR
ncbi:ribonuclease H-like domain-containing protein [Tanacetum coccineum]